MQSHSEILELSASTYEFQWRHDSAHNIYQKERIIPTMQITSKVQKVKGTMKTEFWN